MSKRLKMCFVLFLWTYSITHVTHTSEYNGLAGSILIMNKDSQFNVFTGVCLQPFQFWLKPWRGNINFHNALDEARIS